MKNLDGHKGITHSVLHYLIAIHTLCEHNKRSRMIDISKNLKVARSSASIAIQRLKKQNLINEDKNKNLHLNQNGHDYVHSTLASRSLIYCFLKNILGMKSNEANNYACKIEHIPNKDFQKKIFNFLKKLSSCNNEPIKKYKLDLCLCNYKNFLDFKEKQTAKKY